jgi:hypothetical protein
MKVLFLDFDGVLNSCQSATFWHSKRNQKKWESEMYESWEGTLYEYLAMEFCPIALSNMEELARRFPELKIVISSSWRLHNSVEDLKKILSPAKAIADKVINKTKSLRWADGKETTRGHEIKEWLSRHPEVTHYVIVDDDNDMLEEQKDNFVHTSSLHGFQWGDMLWAERILNKQGETK